MSSAVTVVRSILFAPGSRPERFAKAMASGADAVCLDLEDGVAPDAKERAREEVMRFLGQRAEQETDAERTRQPPATPRVILRINDPLSGLGKADVRSLAALTVGARPWGLMIPKVEGAHSLKELVRALRGGSAPGFHAGDASGGPRGSEGLPRPQRTVGFGASAGTRAGAGSGDSSPAPSGIAYPGVPFLFPLIETPQALESAPAIARADAPLAALVFGGMDLSVELGARFEWEPLLYARSRVVHAAALAEIGAIDVPFAGLDAPADLIAETRRVAALGYTGKLAIHPAQIEYIHAGFTPDADALDRARRIVEASAKAAGGVAVVDGRMVDRPIVLAALEVLERAGEPVDRDAALGQRK